MTVDDALARVRFDEVALSPAGDQVVYSERHLDWENNAFIRRHFLVPATGGETKALGALASDRGFAFSPDGRRLSLLRSTDGADSLWLLPLAGGPPSRLFGHPGRIEDYRWTPDGRRILFVGRRPRDPEAQREWDLGGDAVYVGEGPNGLEAGAWTDLWSFELEGGKASRLSEKDWLIDELEVSPDGRKVLLLARPDDDKNHPELAELYLLGLADRKLVRLTENRAPEWCIRWAPDSRRFVYHAPDDAVHDLRNGYLRIMDLESGEGRRLEAQRQGELGALVWSADGEALIFGEARKTSVDLYRLDVETEEVTALSRARGTLRALAFSADRSRMVFSFEDLETPPDLYLYDFVPAAALPGGGRSAEPVVLDSTLEGAIRLTQSNPWIDEEVALGRGSSFRFTTADGIELEGVLVLPADHDGATKLPLVLDIQGGPGGYWGHQFEDDFHLYAGLGWASLGPNIRGSSGHGDGVLRALMGDVGGVEFDDLMAAVDALVARGIVDPERLALRGWSWGGVLGAWTLAHSGRFKAASLGAMVGDWAFETGPGLMWDLRDHYIGGHWWENPEAWRRHSPLTHVAQVETPTILFHGERDPISSIHQSTAFFTALRERGIPSRFVKLPRQEHDIVEPRLLRIFHVEEVRWLERYVRGREWEPWKRPE